MFLKLGSIPNVEKESLQKEAIKEQTIEPLNENNEEEPSICQADNSIKGIKITEHDSYKKFFKMLQVGVPAQAIKMKMQVEGLDPNILE